RFLHLEPEVVAFARALADAAERRQPAVLLGEVANQLLDDHGLTDTGTAAQPPLAPGRIWGEQVDHLDSGLEHLDRWRQRLDLRRGSVDRPAFDIVGQRLTQIDRLPEQGEDSP